MLASGVAFPVRRNSGIATQARASPGNSGIAKRPNGLAEGRGGPNGEAAPSVATVATH